MLPFCLFVPNLKRSKPLVGHHIIAMAPKLDETTFVPKARIVPIWVGFYGVGRFSLRTIVVPKPTVLGFVT